jgi:hypothetical protein
MGSTFLLSSIFREYRTATFFDKKLTIQLFTYDFIQLEVLHRKISQVINDVL